MLRPLIAAITAVVLCACASAPVVNERAALEASLQRTLQHIIEEQRIPGATAAAALPDGEIIRVSAGYADLEAQTPMPVDAEMPSASIGKTYVSALALALARDGKLDLDAPISTWLADKPWFSRLPNHDAITVRMLLNHTSGLIDHAWGGAYMRAFFTRAASDPDVEFAPEELIAFVLGEPPLFEAGRGYSYSDTNYVLVGMIEEEVGGAPFREQIVARFLRPLGLSQTLPITSRDIPGLVNGYLLEENEIGLPEKSFVDGRIFVNPASEQAGGGFAATAGDLALWAKALYEGRAMEGDYLDEMLTPGFIAPDEGPYGLGVRISDAGPYGQAFGHSGTMPYYGAVMSYFPTYRIAIAIMANRTRFDRVSATLAMLEAVLTDATQADGSQ